MKRQGIIIFFHCRVRHPRLFQLLDQSAAGITGFLALADRDLQASDSLIKMLLRPFYLSLFFDI